jgi:peptidoglycan/xylan/chitin deacetylase (PgdA/CDA1 family)
MIKSISGIQPNYFRPPFGVYTPHVKGVVEHDGMHVVLWSLNSFDSMLQKFKSDPLLYASYLKHNAAFDIAGKASAGDILLMHDYPNTAYALDGILTGLERHGFVFVAPHNKISSK